MHNLSFIPNKDAKDFYNFDNYYKMKEQNRLAKLKRKRLKKHKKKFAKA